jgi:hypothetical protein
MHSLLLIVPALILPCVAMAAPPATPPAPAAAVGYTTRSFDSTTLGTSVGQWYAFNFYGSHAGADNATQDGGNIRISGRGGGNNFGANIATAQASDERPNHWRGIAFGGGFYAVVTMSFSGTPSGGAGVPAFWANDIEMMSGGYASSVHWRGQPDNYADWFEIDVIEANANSARYGIAGHNWYGSVGSGHVVNLALGSPVSLGGAPFSTPQRYAVLWVPANGSTQGYLKFFLNDVQVGATAVWNRYNPDDAPPPLPGRSAGAVMDSRHFVFILGVSNPAWPMTVSGMQVWQGAGADNLIVN